VQRALDFTSDPNKFIAEYEEASEAMQTSITFAREYLKGLTVKREQLKYLCENAIRAGVQGNRGELFAAQVARANAALNGEDIVTADDLQMGVKLCIAPRGTEIQAPPPDDDMMQQPPPPPPPPPPDMEQEETEEDEEEQEQEQPEQEQV
jgi:magnesium chelatase subunit D